MTLGVSAHPISYKGSMGIMTYQSPSLTHTQLNYSFRHWLAAGVHHIAIPNQKKSATFASVNLLLKRWNGSGLQANLYTILGAGQSHLGESRETSGLTGLQFDIEDRDYYFLAKQTQIFHKKGIDLKQTIVRTGFSPYVDPFDGLHSWLILEWKQTNLLNKVTRSDLTPFVRLFYRNLLFELGQSFKGDTKVNLIVHL